VRNLGSVVWLVPVAAQVGYILATYDELPAAIGAGPESGGTAFELFIVEWFAIVGLANLAFSVIHVRLPKLSDRSFRVPGRDFWLATAERKEILIDRLRGICEIVLLLINVFFLAVYQNIYQTNVPDPVMSISPAVLVTAFMVLPLTAIVVAFAVVMRGLAADARRG
jgi:hypothetical protein